MKLDLPIDLIKVNSKIKIAEEPEEEILLTEIINNTSKSYLPYYLAISAVLTLVVVLYIGLYQYLSFSKEEKTTSFIEGSEVSIKNLILTDLKLIFNQSSDLNQISILKNYSYISPLKVKKGIIGTVFYVNRGRDTIIFDLQPLIFLIDSILKQSFYYQISLNDSVLVSNAEEKSFFYIKKYQVNEENFLTIKLTPKINSNFKQNQEMIFKDQVVTLIITLTLLFFLLSLFVIYLLGKKISYDRLKKKVFSMEKNFNLNIDYVKSCVSLIREEKITTILPVKTSQINEIKISDIIEEIKASVYVFTARFGYKFELRLVSLISNIRVKYDLIIFRQIILSLLYNIMYFMRGGEHKKRFSIEFQKDKIIMIYDSFAANEQHMSKWSRELFQHIGNPYILECEGVFQLIKNCGLSYEINPKQGMNEIIIFLNQNEDIGRVVNFYKKK